MTLFTAVIEDAQDLEVRYNERLTKAYQAAIETGNDPDDYVNLQGEMNAMMLRLLTEILRELNLLRAAVGIRNT